MQIFNNLYFLHISGYNFGIFILLFPLFLLFFLSFSSAQEKKIYFCVEVEFSVAVR